MSVCARVCPYVRAYTTQMLEIAIRGILLVPEEYEGALKPWAKASDFSLFL